MSTEEATDGYWAEIKRAAYLKGADAGGAGRSCGAVKGVYFPD